jgi:hypothetical protein
MVKRKKMNGGQFILPNFLVVGAAKSGTTALYYQLKRHPEIFCCPVKEPCYFSGRVLRLPQPGIGDERKFYVKTYADYCKLFEGAEGKKAIGEASADTLYFYEKTIPLIKQVLGNPRIIILLRSPVDRAFSAYLHLVRDNREALSFEEGLAREEERIHLDWQCMWHYKNRGMYYAQVKAFKTEFSRVLVCLYDDFKKEPQAVINQVCQFLEVDPDFQPANTRSRYNASGIPRFRSLNNIFLMKNIVQRTLRKVGSFVLTEDGWVKFRDSLRAKLYVKAVMKPDTRAYLQQVFREDILKLQNLLARDLGGWLKTEG